MEIKNGELIVNVADHLTRDPACLRAFGQSVLFDELLIKAITQFILEGQVQWSEDEPVWWIGHSDGKRGFEDARRLVAGLADKASLVLIDDLTNALDTIRRERDIFKTRAWRAERMVRYNKDVLLQQMSSDQDHKDLGKICTVKAHAQESDV